MIYRSIIAIKIIITVIITFFSIMPTKYLQFFNDVGYLMIPYFFKLDFI